MARYITRPALPNHINDVLVPFLERVKEKHDKQSPEGHCFDKVAEFRLEAAPNIDHPARGRSAARDVPAEERTDLRPRDRGTRPRRHGPRAQEEKITKLESELAAAHVVIAAQDSLIDAYANEVEAPPRAAALGEGRSWVAEP